MRRRKPRSTNSKRGSCNTPQSCRISNRRIFWWTRCAADRRHGRACESISSTCRKRFARNNRSFLPRLIRGPGWTLPCGTEDRGKLKSRSDFELIVAAVRGRLVVTPAKERRSVAEAITLHVVVLHFADPLDTERLPRQILAGAPAAHAARHAL